MPDDALISSLRAAVAAAPADAPLRLHLAELLLGAGRSAEAVTEAATVLQHDPASTPAHELLGRAGAALAGGGRSDAIAQHPSSAPAAEQPDPGPPSPPSQPSQPSQP